MSEVENQNAHGQSLRGRIITALERAKRREIDLLRLPPLTEKEEAVLKARNQNGFLERLCRGEIAAEQAAKKRRRGTH
jgi:hypothetical protein